MQSWIDLTLMILTFVLSMIWNVEVGIVVSIIISLLLVVRRSSKTRMAILVRFPSITIIEHYIVDEFCICVTGKNTWYR